MLIDDFSAHYHHSEEKSQPAWCVRRNERNLGRAAVEASPIAFTRRSRSGPVRELCDRREIVIPETNQVFWTGEFGRTPVINRNQGRDHIPTARTTARTSGEIRTEAVGRPVARKRRPSDCVLYGV
jgi:hypothetical protein